MGDKEVVKKSQLDKISISTFHHKCIRQLCGYTMYHVREHHINTKKCMEKTNLKSIETYITVCQLRFLSRITKMEKTRLTHQVINSQAIPQGKCTKGIQTTKRAYKDALIRAGLINKKKGNERWWNTRDHQKIVGTKTRLIQKRKRKEKEGERSI